MKLANQAYAAKGPEERVSTKLRGSAIILIWEDPTTTSKLAEAVHRHLSSLRATSDEIGPAKKLLFRSFRQMDGFRGRPRPWPAPGTPTGKVATRLKLEKGHIWSLFRIWNGIFFGSWQKRKKLLLSDLVIVWSFCRFIKLLCLLASWQGSEEDRKVQTGQLFSTLVPGTTLTAMPEWTWASS